MTEENKQENQEEVKQEAPQEEAEQVSQEAVQAPKEAAAEATKEEVKDKTPQKIEIPKNCGACKKPVAKMRYYRNMKFFCSKKCWKTFKDKEAKNKEEAQQKTAA